MTRGDGEGILGLLLWKESGMEEAVEVGSRWSEEKKQRYGGPELYRSIAKGLLSGIIWVACCKTAVKQVPSR